MFEKIKALLINNIKWNSLSGWDAIICDAKTMEIS